MGAGTTVVGDFDGHRALRRLQGHDDAQGDQGPQAGGGCARADGVCAGLDGGDGPAAGESGRTGMSMLREAGDEVVSVANAISFRTGVSYGAPPNGAWPHNSGGLAAGSRSRAVG
jgi:hypothetical protein